MRAQYVYENVRFQRGRDPREVRRDLSGRTEYYPGQILIEESDRDLATAGNLGDIVLFRELLPPNYVGERNMKVVTLGFLNGTWDKATNYGAEFEINDYNIGNHVSGKKLRFPTPDEEQKIKKYLNKSKLRKIKESVGLVPILNGKKIIKESVNFERGQDPKDSMSIGVAPTIKPTDAALILEELYMAADPINEVSFLSDRGGDAILVYWDWIKYPNTKREFKAFREIIKGKLGPFLKRVVVEDHGDGPFYTAFLKGEYEELFSYGFELTRFPYKKTYTDI